MLFVWQRRILPTPQIIRRLVGVPLLLLLLLPLLQPAVLLLVIPRTEAFALVVPTTTTRTHPHSQPSTTPFSRRLYFSENDNDDDDSTTSNDTSSSSSSKNNNNNMSASRRWDNLDPKIKARLVQAGQERAVANKAKREPLLDKKRRACRRMCSVVYDCGLCFVVYIIICLSLFLILKLDPTQSMIPHHPQDACNSCWNSNAPRNKRRG